MGLNNCFKYSCILTAQKVSEYGVFSVLCFSVVGLIMKIYWLLISIFGPNTRNTVQEKLNIGTHFTQWFCQTPILFSTFNCTSQFYNIFEIQMYLYRFRQILNYSLVYSLFYVDLTGFQRPWQKFLKKQNNFCWDLNFLLRSKFYLGDGKKRGELYLFFIGCRSLVEIWVETFYF